MLDSFEASLGERIRYYRKRKGITQKQLAELCGITEPAIRNYELDNRIPGYETLNAIAWALDVNYYTLAEPDLSSLPGAMHVLFRMEYAHGLKPIELDGRAVIAINKPKRASDESFVQLMMNRWLEARKKFDSGEWTEKQYEDWLIRYPNVLPYGPVEEGDQDEDRVVIQPAKKKHPRKKPKKPVADQ